MSVNIAKNKPKIFGLTGGIASGKTMAANFFVIKGIDVFDSDQAVKKIWRENLEAQSFVFNKYQIDITTDEGKKALADLIFENNQAMEEINDLIHPLVFLEIEKWYELSNDREFCIIDMPLLFETGYHKKVEKTILVAADLDLQIQRLAIRDGNTKEKTLKIIDNQMSLEDKKQKSDYVVENNGTIEEFYQKLEKLYEVLINESDK